MSYVTKKALAHALRELLRTKKLNKINISDITDFCHMSRQTFYYHFSDIYDLIEWSWNELLSMIQYNTKKCGPREEYIKEVFYQLLEEKNVVLNAYYALDQRIIENYFQSFILPRVNEIISKEPVAIYLNIGDRKFIEDFYTNALTSIVIHWFEAGMPPTYEIDVENYFKIMESTIVPAIEAFAKKGD